MFRVQQHRLGQIAGSGGWREGQSCDHILANDLRFAANYTVTYQALSGRKLYRVTQPLP
jgi:hypothetical protein